MGAELLIDMESGRGHLKDLAKDAMVAQANIQIRMGFLRKVYGILSFQLLLTLMVTSVAMFSPIVRFFINENAWLVSLSSIASLILLFALMVKSREFPTNYILLALFTPVEAFTVAVITTFYDEVTVVQAFVLTVTVTVGLTIFTFQTKKDFSTWKTGLMSGLWIMIITGFVGIFFGSTAWEIFMATAGSILFCLFIIYDTQRIMQDVSPEEYILATIELYLDIINLFLHLLRLLNATRRK